MDNYQSVPLSISLQIISRNTQYQVPELGPLKSMAKGILVSSIILTILGVSPERAET